MKTTYTLVTKVTGIEEKFTRQYVSGAGKDTVFRDVSRGWFVLLEGINDWIYLDVLPPLPDELDVGDTVHITLAKA